MRLSDMLFRQGHLSDAALIDALMLGNRPAHLERCDLCAERAIDVGRWLDDVRAVGNEAVDAVFTADRLAAQHAQILRRLEQLDQPARVIAFPAQSRFDAREPSVRRIAPVWLGVAAAAGLVLGVAGSQFTTRLAIKQPVAVAVIAPPAPAVTATAPAATTPNPSRSFIDEDFDRLPITSLDHLDDITPRLIQLSAGRRGG